jgi:aspartyl-tRNA(Asn)/glutamyl-tRNA(Gln) amidotransferase subunit C
MSQHHIDIHRIATLARLKLTEAEAAKYGAQLGNVLDYVAVLEQHDLGSADTPLSASAHDVWRDDEARESFTNEQALANAPKKSQGQFLMPRVVEE